MLKQNRVVAVIWCGGKGTRMRISGPKQLIEVDGKASNELQRTLLGRLVSQLQKIGVGRIILGTGRNYEGIGKWLSLMKGKGLINTRIDVVGEKFFFWRPKYRNIRKFISSTENALFLYGDTIYNNYWLKKMLSKARVHSSKPFVLVPWGKQEFKGKRNYFTRIGKLGLIANSNGIEFLEKHLRKTDRIKPWSFALKPKILKPFYAGPFMNVNTKKELAKAGLKIKQAKWRA